MKPVLKQSLLVILLSLGLAGKVFPQTIPGEFIDPPGEFSLMPFWFWNDTLKDEEIIRQIAGFEAHGVYGFVIHPRIGLPADMAWLSPGMIHAMRVAIEEAARRKMYVVLYDEGMYPSGSSSGQVVARNPEYAARGLAKIDLKPGEKLNLPDGATLITTIDRPGGGSTAIIEKPSGGVIRGLHYLGEGGKELMEETPPAADILNPEAVASFVDLVYERYSKEFGNYFGTTIAGIFTDEPSPLGRGSEKGMMPGNAALLRQICRILGYDITPFLGDLWYDDQTGSRKHRIDYFRAINSCLEENYYTQLGNWCRDHGISLMGHPAGSMDISTERYFQIPGQDLVWRYVEPGLKAINGEHSTMAKCAESAMVHEGLHRNSNELYGAYGHNLTWAEMVWLANWCFVRGQNLLIPHAFYYSIRGPRFDERPPDVGPNASWWDNYKPFADACRRLCWLNTDSKQVCSLAILCESAWLPDEAAKTCYCHQLDFNYLEIRYLWENAKVDETGIHLSGMNYNALIIDSLSFMPEKAIPALKNLADNGRLIILKKSPLAYLLKGSKILNRSCEITASVNKLIPSDIILNPAAESIRFRHVIKNGDHFYIFFNEEGDEVRTKITYLLSGSGQWLDPFTAEAVPAEKAEIVRFKPFELKILWIGHTN
jgi:hypothetical protein